MITCIYHGQCADGLGALWAVVQKYGRENVEAVAGFYGSKAPDVTGKKVLMVDFSYPRDAMQQMISQAESFTCLDHHASARDALDGLPGCVFDMARSGAVMAWEFLFPNTEVPPVLLYIQDRDIWAWKMPMSREVSEVMARAYDWSQPLDEQLARVTENNRMLREEFDKVTVKGSIIRETTERLVAAHADSWFWVTVNDVEIPAAFCHPVLASDTGNVLASLPENEEKTAVCISAGHDGKYGLSFRSVNGGAKALALSLGGGGHPNAAGAGVCLDKLYAILATRRPRKKDGE